MPGEPLEVSAAGGPMLFSYDDIAPSYDGRSDTLELHTSFRTPQRETQKLYHIPVPLHATTAQRLRHDSWQADQEILWGHGVSRPQVRSQEDESEEPGLPLWHFVLAMVARMQDFESALEASFLPWEEIYRRWLSSSAHQDPTMDVLVRHAQQHHARWVDLVERPRRILNRRRELVPLGRVEELDTHCMQWLSRQPGRSIAERAGDDQRILALARYENLNTLENRVLKDLMERSAVAAREYLTINQGRRQRDHHGRTTRMAVVERYGRECRRLSRALSEVGVGRETGSFQPNFVLLQDPRYRHAWQAWREIVNRERVFDDLWRWQRRSWAEFCRAACAVALLKRPHAELVAASPIFFRPEHRRGEWLIHDDPMVVVADRRQGWIAEVLCGDSRDVGLMMAELGASVWIRFADLAGGDFRYVAVWAINGLMQRLAFDDLIPSADMALQVTRQQARRTGASYRLVGGLVLQSLVSPDEEVSAISGERTSGVAFGPFDGQLADGLSTVATALDRLLGEAT